MTDDKITRRDFLKATLAGSSALGAPTIINYLGKSSPSSDKEFLEIRDGKFYMGGDEYIMKGANYLSRDNPWRVIKRFDPEQIDRELDLASELGINTVRMALRTTDAQENIEKHFKNFSAFLDIADKHGIKVMPIAIDHAPWRYFEPENRGAIRSYLEKWLPEYKDDERILAWDVKNEPDVHQRLMKKEHGDKYDVEGFTKNAAQIIKELDENHPITIGLSDTQGNPGEVRGNLIQSLPEYIKYEDFYSFHYYVPLGHFDVAMSRIREETDKPVVMGEFGLPTKGELESWNEAHQKRYIDSILSNVSKYNLSGAVLWKLLDNPSGSIEDPDGEYDYHWGVLRTDYSKKAAAHVVEQYYKWFL